MTPERQLELPLAAVGPGVGGRERIARARRSGAAASAEAFGWLPLLALFGLFAQVALLGLRPAMAERARLAEQAAVVAAREARLVAENDVHRMRLAALSDPVFQERVRRARRSAAFPTPPRPLDLPLSALDA